VIYLRVVVKIIVINPKDRKRAIKCCDCGISYSIEDYETLFNNEKLIYFKFKPPNQKSHKIYCHSCLLTAVQKNYPFDEVPLSIIDDNYEYYCRLYNTEDSDVEIDDDDDDDSDFLSGLGDIFKK